MLCANTSLAADPAAPTCNDVLSLCGRALNARNAELKLSDLALKARTEQNVALLKAVESQERQLGAWYRNPFFLVGIGLIGGALLVK